MLKQNYFQYTECIVTTVSNTQATVPAGRHITIELNSQSGGVSIRPTGKAIDIGPKEWERLKAQGLVR